MTTRTRYGATIDAVITLLDGRERMARALLETLGNDVAVAMRRAAAEAYEAGHAEGRRDLAAAEITGGEFRFAYAVGESKVAKPKRQPAPKRHEWLAQRIRDPELRERAKKLRPCWARVRRPSGRWCAAAG